MQMITKLGLGLIAAVWAFGAQAASFDCGKAASDVEKMICADQTLSDLDNALAAVYQQVIFRSTNPTDLKAGQLAWLKGARNVCLTVDCVELAYRQRLTDLRAIPVVYSSLAVAIDGTCRELAALESNQQSDGCTLIDTGAVGKIGDANFHYARYCIAWASENGGSKDIMDCDISSIALFQQQKSQGQAQRFYQYTADIGSFVYEPLIQSNEYGQVLALPVGISGTGAFNDDQYFIWRKNHWVHMDSQRWLLELNRRIPYKLEIMKGVKADLASLTAQAWLYQDSDSNCCPTGGTAMVDLGIAGNLLFIKAMRIEPPQAN